VVPKGVLDQTLRFRAYLEFGRGGVCVIVLTGEADAHAAPELEARLAECCAAPALEQVVVDLTRATFLDSVALSVLINAHKRLKRRGLGLKVVCGDRNIRRLLTITGLDRLFSLYGSTAEAVRDRALTASRVSERSPNRERTSTDDA
jgi:anti-sigma B factor antagonist